MICLKPFSNFPYDDFRRGFKKDLAELIQLQDIDDLKDLFTEFGDFGFEMVSVYYIWDIIVMLVFILKVFQRLNHF